MIKEISVKELITYEEPPDGGRIPIIDPYDGCTLNCPYCFQLNDNTWNEHLYIKKNIPDLINEQLKDWPKDKVIYIGSRCDPFMNIEEEYRLTSKCLIELDKLNIPITITTKSNNDVLIRDIPIIKNYSADITILMGLSNLNELEKSKNNKVIKNIEIANLLHSEGIKVWAFITPILSGITDVEKMIQDLNQEIPVYLDKLRLYKGSRQYVRMINYIKEKYPKLLETYENIAEEDDDKYVNDLRNKFYKNESVKFIFE